MPFKGIKCPDPAMDDLVEGRACYECAVSRGGRTCHFPPFLIAEIVPGISGEEYDPMRESYSPSRMLACKRQVALQRQVDYYVDPAGEWSKVRGTVTHTFAGNSPLPDYILSEVKRRRSLSVNGEEIEVAGIVDYFNTRTGELVDYKTVSYITDPMKNEAKPDWSAQLSVYRWLLAPEYVVERAYIAMIAPKQPPFYREYRLWSLVKTEGWLVERSVELMGIYHDGDVAGVLPINDQWKCEGCPVRDACTELAVTDGEAPPNPELMRAMRKKR